MRTLELFKEAMESMDGDCLGLSMVPCIMSALNSHIESEQEAHEEDSVFVVAREDMLLDHSDRSVDLPVEMTKTCCASACRNVRDWLTAEERTCGATSFLLTLT